MNKLIDALEYRAAVYVRLSKEDGDKEESDSISNQKELISRYLSGQPDIRVCETFVDDGFSGVNFERPGFKKMLNKLEAREINCVVVKDLSRFGRNFVEAGRLIDKVFPALGIRFIAINDGYDTRYAQKDNNKLLVPFKNLINDAYCRDISIKIRSQLDVKRKKGDFIGNFAVYGYLKDPSDRHRLVIDDQAADVVRDIFKWKLEGMSQQRIADKLNGLGVLSPMEHKRYCGLRYQTGFQVNPCAKWTAVAVGRILRNEFYIGTLAQGKRTTPNYKVKKQIAKPREEWACIENSHPPIIAREDFQTANSLLLQDTRVAPGEDTVYLFSGLVFCGDCKQNMVRNSVCQGGKTYLYYMCGKNRARKGCTSHRISEKLVEQAVLQTLKQHIGIILDLERVLAIIETLPMQKEDVRKLDVLLIQKQDEIKRYEGLKADLYEAMDSGIVTKDEFLQFKVIYEEKRQRAVAAERKLQSELDGLLQNHSGKQLWIERFKQFRNISELTRPIAVTLIDRIYVYENKRMEIRFKYQYDFERAVTLIANISEAHSIDHAAKEAV